MKKILSTALFTLVLISCSEKKEVAKVEKGAIYFKSVPADSSGIDFTNTLQQSDDLNIIEYLYYYNGGGVAIGDINNDGLEDVYLTANQTPDKLYLNLGNLKFKDITKAAGLQIDSTWSTGVTMEDVNNDGFLDIYVSKVGNYKSFKAHNLLYINNGDTTFREISAVYGLDFSGLSTQASFFDYDNDGDMDLYLMNHSIHSTSSYGHSNQRQIRDSLSGDRFYENKLNEGLQKFQDVTEASGIFGSALGYGLALTTADINKDGFIDIYVGNDFHENDYLYINQGTKIFKESAENYLNHTSRFTMGVDIADLNNDQQQDIFTLDMMPYDAEIFLKSGGEDSDKISRIKKNFGFSTQYARNVLQLQQQNHTFSDVALMTNTHATDWSWSPLIQDYDNDGLNDIYITNGIYKRPNDLNYINYLSNIDFAKYDQTKQNDLERQLIELMPTIPLPNVVFHNKGDMEFDRLVESSGSSPSYSNGAAYSDLDNDGDLDLIVNNINQPAFLLENRSAHDTKHAYVSFSLQGDDTFKNTTGTKVYVYSEGNTHYRELNITKGFQSASSHKLHFGLGESKRLDSVKIQWQDGKTQIEKGLAINQNHVIARNPTSAINNENKAEELYSYTIFLYTHIENDYLDYERETLMPEKLSAEGPPLIRADFNGDGLQDIFIGGAKAQAPVLFVQQKNGEYRKDKESDFIKDIIYEDVDATTLDLEGDGDLDLYVMSGGNDAPEEDMHLEDRIYVNDGSGKFVRLEISLIKTNGGSVSAADFDGDGAEDLFIGNRSIPGAYGLSPISYILKNNGEGMFGILQQDRIGMVTDSEWADMDNDGLLDLVIVGDWMPITILINQGNSRFLDETKKFGLENTQGMWNTIAIADLDNDGQNDILAGNAGLNFKWKASAKKPIKLYLDDYDVNEQPDPIIFYDYNGKNVPFASRNKLSEQLPSLKKKFLDYKAFSMVNTIEGLTGKKEDSLLSVKEITELRSMAFFNLGESFKAIPLPKATQMSSIEDFIIEQIEGKTRIIYVGNYLDYVVELGQSNARSGGIISVDEKGNMVENGNLPLPTKLNARRIIKMDDGSFLVVSSNDKAYRFELPEKAIR